MFMKVIFCGQVHVDGVLFSTPKIGSDVVKVKGKSKLYKPHTHTCFFVEGLVLFLGFVLLSHNQVIWVQERSSDVSKPH